MSIDKWDSKLFLRNSRKLAFKLEIEICGQAKMVVKKQGQRFAA